MDASRATSYRDVLPRRPGRRAQSQRAMTAR